MTLTADTILRARFKVAFPAAVQGEGGIKVTKANGIYTLSPDWAALALVQGAAVTATMQTWVYDPATGVYYTATLSQLLGLRDSDPTELTEAGPHTVPAIETVVFVNQTVGAAMTINLPTTSSRLGLEILVKDAKGDAGTNNITIVPADGETIEGETSFVIASDRSFVRLKPWATRTKWAVVN